MKNNALHTTI